MSKKLRAFLLLLPVLAFIGCSGSDRPPLHPVSGVVTFNGGPLANASIVFMPENGLVAVGRTDADGKFSLKTQGEPGAASGTYKVVITATDRTKEVTAEEMENMTDSERNKLFKTRIPPKFGNPELSELNATVGSGQKNEFSFNISE